MSRLRTPVTTAVLAAVYAVISQIVIPFPAVPLTLQCFAIALGAAVFGWRVSLASIILYIGMGAIGLPVFAFFRGGADALLGPTGGFIWGFVLMGIPCGLAEGKGRLAGFSLALIGLVACHLLGTVQFAFVTGTSFAASLLSSSAPYILKDALLVWVALGLAKPISAAIYGRK